MARKETKKVAAKAKPKKSPIVRKGLSRTRSSRTSVGISGM